jgi:hypothetical protein
MIFRFRRTLCAIVRGLFAEEENEEVTLRQAVPAA